MSKKSRKKTPDKDADTTLQKGVSVSVKRFAFTYLALMGAFFVIIGFKPIQHIMDLNGVYTTGVVLATSRLLSVLNIPCTCQGSIINLPSISLDIKFGCNGLEAVMIYSVAVVAFPSTWKNKLIGVTTGFIAIQVVNILRIVSLAYSGIHFRSLFEIIHIYIAQGMMIAVSLGVFFLYLHYAGTETTSAA